MPIERCESPARHGQFSLLLGSVVLLTAVPPLFSTVVAVRPVALLLALQRSQVKVDLTLQTGCERRGRKKGGGGGGEVRG